MYSVIQPVLSVLGQHTMLFVQTQIFVVPEFGILCSLEQIKFLNCEYLCE